MKVTFAHIRYESLSIQKLSAELKAAGHETALVFNPMIFLDHWFNMPRLGGLFYRLERFVEEILSTEPDVVGFSCFTDDFHWALQVAREIKKKSSVPIIVGGIHATLVPQHVMQHDCIDFACVGEGGEALCELLQCLAAGDPRPDVPGIWARRDGQLVKNGARPLERDLDTLPFLDKDLFYDQAPYFKKVYVTMTTLGCPYRCTYCCHAPLREVYPRGKYVRHRSLDNVMAELKWAKEKYEPKLIYFYDDMFVTTKARLKDFAARYKEHIGLPFTCINHPRVLDEEAVQILKDCGCVSTDIGIQSLNEVSRKVLMRAESDEDIRRAGRSLHEHGIPFKVDIMGGIPGESEEDLARTAMALKELDPARISFFMLRYYPRVPIARTAREMDLVSDDLLRRTMEGMGASPHDPDCYIDPAEFAPFHVFYSVLPKLPARLVRFLVEKKRYRTVFKQRFKSIVSVALIAAYFPDYLRKREDRGITILGVYKSTIAEALRRRFGRKTAAGARLPSPAGAGAPGAQ